LSQNDIYPFDLFLGYHLRRASVLVMADLTAALGPLGLKPAEASVLFLIGGHDGITQAEIGRALGIQRANMAPLIAHLMETGLVVKVAVNGRSQALRLSPAGMDVHGQAIAATRAHEARLFGGVSEVERKRLIAVLRGLWEENS
jgi:DNA-binding MarR family transcriptional regulator